MEGQSRANGQRALKIVQWNAEGVRLLKTKLQHFLKLKEISVCCIQKNTCQALIAFFHKGLRGVSTRQRKPTKERTADPGEKQHTCRKNPEILSSWSGHGVSGSQTGSGRNTSDCLQHLFTILQADPSAQHPSRTPVLDYHRRLQQPLTKLRLWVAQQQRSRSGKLDHRKSAYSDQQARWPRHLLLPNMENQQHTGPSHCHWWHPRNRRARSVITTLRQWPQAGGHLHQRPDTVQQKQSTSKLELQKSQVWCF